MTEEGRVERKAEAAGATDALQMLQRMERLKKLMGSSQQTEKPMAVGREKNAFARSRSENIVSAAIPFLDREYQKEIYVVIRLMEMKRILSEGVLEPRERKEEPPQIRKQKMLQAIRPYLQEEERRQMEMLMKMTAIRELMEQGEER